MTNYVNDAAVIPYSVYEAVEMIPDAEMRALTYKMLILNALNDSAEVTGNPMVDMVLTMARPTQISTAQRYQKAKENGQKGGRPSKISRDVVFELRQRGYTQTQIASALDCHVNSIRNILRGDETITDNNLEKEIEVKKRRRKRSRSRGRSNKCDKGHNWTKSEYAVIYYYLSSSFLGYSIF